MIPSSMAVVLAADIITAPMGAEDSTVEAEGSTVEAEGSTVEAEDFTVEAVDFTVEAVDSMAEVVAMVEAVDTDNCATSQFACRL